MICNRTKNLQHLITFYDKEKIDLSNLFLFNIMITFFMFKLVEIHFIRYTRILNGNEPTNYILI